MTSKNTQNSSRSGESLARLDKNVVWHPFTPMKLWMSDPDDQPGRVISQAEGFTLIDALGNRFIDGNSSLWCNLHGHQVPQIDNAIKEQLGKIAHSTLLGHASPPSIELAEKLVNITPESLKKVFYSDSGATSVEIAVKIAYQYFQNVGQPERRRFLALKQSYHGDTIGSVSIGGIDTFHGIFGPLLFETTYIDTPNPYHSPAGQQSVHHALRQIEAELEAAGPEYCAIVIEPLVQGAAGILTHPDGFLKGVRELTKRYGVLMIVDEVATGFCRTGKLFACEHENVDPDMMCLAKGLSGGYLPVAATMTSQEIFDGFVDDPTAGKTFYHGHTFTGNALGCAAACASVDLIFESGMLDTLQPKIELVTRYLSQLKDHPHVGDIRQRGLMCGIELMKDRQNKTPFEPGRRMGAKVCYEARKYGLIIRPLGDVMVLMPAPAMDIETLDQMMKIVVRTVNEYFEQE